MSPAPLVALCLVASVGAAERSRVTLTPKRLEVSGELPVGFEAPRISTSSTPVVRKAQALMEEDRYPDAIKLLALERQVNPGSAEVLLNLGWANWHQNRPEPARSAWALLYSLDPRNPLFVRLFAAIELELGRPASAERLAREALSLAPLDVEAAVVLAKALVALSRVPEAQALAEKFLERYPRHHGLLYQAGEIYDLQRRFEKSLPLYDLLVSLAPRQAKFGRRRAWALYELGRFEEAVAEWKRLIAFDPPDAGSLRALGRVYWDVQAYDEAWEHWLRLAQRYPNDPAVLSLVAAVQIERGRLHDALALAKRIRSLAPDDADGVVVHARALARLGRPKEAVSVLREFIRRHPDDAEARFQLADLLYQLGLYAEAIEQYDSLLRRRPGAAAYRRLRAQAVFALGRHAEALREWEVLVSTSPPDVLSYYNLARAYAVLGRYDLAIDAAERLIALEPGRPDGFVLLSSLELDRGDPDAAARAAESALERAPGDRDGSVALARADLARARVDDARGRLKSLLPRHKYHQGVLLQLAETELADLRPEDALPHLDRLGSLFPAEPSFRRRRGDALHALGRFDEALAEWKRLAEDEPGDPRSADRLIEDALAAQDWDRAIDWLGRPGSTTPPRGADLLRLAAAQLAAGAPERALRSADQAVLVDTGSVSARLLRAESLEALGRFAEAEEIHRSLLARSPNAERSRLALIRLAQARGDYAAALQRVREASRGLGGLHLELREARLLADSGEQKRALELARAAAGRPRGVLVLAYPALSRFGRDGGVSVSRFEEHLAVLKEAGYRTVTIGDLAAGGSRLPPKAVLIAVDDPTARVLKEADAALRRKAFKAAAFVRLGASRPGYPRAGALVEAERSGRWEVHALGVKSVEPIRVDAGGRPGRFFASRAWEGGRGEKKEEFLDRVERELEESRRLLDDLVAWRPAEGPRAFAFPGGEFGQGEESNHPAAARVTAAAALRSFDLAFARDAWGRNRPPYKGRLLRRLEVDPEWSGERLAARLAADDPAVAAAMLEGNLYLALGKSHRALLVFAKLQQDGVKTAELYAQTGVAYERIGRLARAARQYRKAVELEPGNQRYAELYAAARLALGPRVEPKATGFEDTERRAAGKGLFGFATSLGDAQVQAWGGLGRYRELDTSGVQAREAGARVWVPFGIDASAEVLAVRRDYSLAAATVDDLGRLRPGGRLRATDSLSAAVVMTLVPGLEAEVGAALDDVESARAILAGRRVRTQRAGLDWEAGNDWGAAAGFEFRTYNDGNRERAARLSGFRRLSHDVSAGYALTHSEARRASALYYSPGNLNQHMLVVSARPGDRKLRGLLQAGAGWGFQEGRSRFVQNLKAGVTWRFLDRFILGAAGGYSRAPTYSSREFSTTLTVGF